MERIVFELDDAMAKKWRHTDSKVKERIFAEVGKILETILSKEEDDLWPFLEKLRAEAERKGFDDKILNDILNEK